MSMTDNTSIINYIFQNDTMYSIIINNIYDDDKNSLTFYFKNKEDETLCKICYKNKINNALMPCGHLYCSDCIKKGI